MLLPALALLGPAAAAATAGDAAQPCAHAVPAFAAWGDDAPYAPAVHGTLETTAAWALTGDAALVDGNEPFFVYSRDDAHSLALPDGSSATAHVGCVGGVQPQIRLFVRNTGLPGSTLRVEVRNGGTTAPATTVAVLIAGPEWAPTAPIAVPVPAPADAGAMGTMRITFTPQGVGSGWQIDDVSVDPYKQS